MEMNSATNPYTTEDILILRHHFIQVDSDLRASYRIISNLESENKHLRELIALLISNNENKKTL